tara:strand:+ start:456 stop:629 length:174 start_codon:yes stop_codon:yes gene_type:complete
MRVKKYSLIEQIVEQGVAAGYRRAHKHTDSPDEETITYCVEQYIMQGFDEYFDFDED